MIYVQTSWWIACSKCCVLTMARILPAEFEAQYGVTISILDSHASTLCDISGVECKLNVICYTIRTNDDTTNLPDCGSVDGFGPTLGRAGPWLWLLLRLLLLFFVCRVSRHLLKYDSPCVRLARGNSSTLPKKSAGGWSNCEDTSRFFLLLSFGGPYSLAIWKSPYMRLINALFSSMKSSMRSLIGYLNKLIGHIL